jgi:hypothetical protein
MFKGRFAKDGKGLVFSDFFREKMKAYGRQNPGQPFEITPILIESNKQRGWFEGALCPLMTFYQEGMDYRNHKDVNKVREWLKLEFNSELVVLAGKEHRIAKTTKNELNKGFLEKCVDYLIENYAPPIQAIDPKYFKDWHDRIFPYGGPDNYIDYLLKVNILKRMNTGEKESLAMESGIDPDSIGAEDYGDMRDDGPNYNIDYEE